MSRMPLRTRVFASILDRSGGESITTMDLSKIQRDRQRVVPSRAPVRWITGPVRADVARTTRTVQARDRHEVPLRVYRPLAAAPDLPVIVYFHGGGWVLGNVRGYDPICSFLAHAVGAVVVSVDYRLAPEHRAPTGAHDCVDAVRWIAAHAKVMACDASRLALCGDSAGGNLAAVVAQVLRDGGPPIAHQALLYPATDATLGSPSIREHADGHILTRADIDAFRAHYLGPDGLDPTDPLVSPLLAADLSGLPPALIQTADLDPLRDDGIRYARALESAGVRVRLTNYLGAPHGFASFPGATTFGAQARAELAGELRRHLHAS